MGQNEKIMGYPRNTQGRSMGDPWVITEASWSTRGRPMGNSWASTNKLMSYPRATHMGNIYILNERLTHGQPMWATHA